MFVKHIYIYVNVDVIIVRPNSCSNHLHTLHWLQVVPDASHSANEVGIAANWLQLTES
jgi:hypothetical protein